MPPQSIWSHDADIYVNHSKSPSFHLWDKKQHMQQYQEIKIASIQMHGEWKLPTQQEEF